MELFKKSSIDTNQLAFDVWRNASTKEVAEILGDDLEYLSDLVARALTAAAGDVSRGIILLADNFQNQCNYDWRRFAHLEEQSGRYPFFLFRPPFGLLEAARRDVDWVELATAAIEWHLATAAPPLSVVHFELMSMP